MKINVSGHHVEISPAIKDYLDEKFAKIANHFSSLIALDVTITKEHGEFHVELRTKYEGASIATSGKDKVMYPAISKATKKLDAALAHRKGILKDNLHEKPNVSTPEIAHEIIQNMELN